MNGRRNLELKCSCADLDAVRRRAVELPARDAGIREQEDVFFPTAAGARLKLRRVAGARGELISYRRADRAGSRASDYLVLRTDQDADLGQVLAHALGTCGVVRKRRHLLLAEHTRIHLDEVEGLGSFVELETVLEGISDEEGRLELDRIARALGLDPDLGISGAYLDLLAAR